MSKKLSDKEVRHIRAVYQPWRITIPVLAAKYGVSVGLIHKVISFKKPYQKTTAFDRAVVELKK